MVAERWTERRCEMELRAACRWRTWSHGRAVCRSNVCSVQIATREQGPILNLRVPRPARLKALVARCLLLAAGSALRSGIDTDDRETTNNSSVRHQQRHRGDRLTVCCYSC